MLNKDYLRSLAADAKTPEELESVRKLAKELMANEGQAAPAASRWVVRTLAEVAEFFSVATQTAKQWRTETPPMPGEEGAWDLQEIVKWRHDRATAGTSRFAKAQQELERGQVKLEKEKLELQLLQSSVLDREEVEEWASVVLAETRELITQLPGAVSSVCNTQDRDGVLAQADDIVRQTLECLFERLTEHVDVKGDATTEAAA